MKRDSRFDLLINIFLYLLLNSFFDVPLYDMTNRTIQEDSQLLAYHHAFPDEISRTILFVLIIIHKLSSSSSAHYYQAIIQRGRGKQIDVIFWLVDSNMVDKSIKKVSF